MVRKIHKTNIIFSIITTVLASVPFAITASAATESPQKDVDFRVTVNEVLAVSLTTPANWAKGDLNASTGESDLLRNKVVLSVTSNNDAGFVASMTTNDNASGTYTATDLINQSKNSVTIPTLTSVKQASEFPVNYWGYSLNDSDAGSDSAEYAGLVAKNGTPISVLSNNTRGNVSQDIYFGAKANFAKGSGTYAKSVVISVVSGVISDTNPTVPTNPNTPSDDTTANDDTATHVARTNTTVGTYTGTTGSGTSSVTGTQEQTITTITPGDTRSSYADPQGVTDTQVAEASSPVATGFAVTAAGAATTGFGLLVASKRKRM